MQYMLELMFASKTPSWWFEASARIL